MSCIVSISCRYATMHDLERRTMGRVRPHARVSQRTRGRHSQRFAQLYRGPQIRPHASPPGRALPCETKGRHPRCAANAKHVQSHRTNAPTRLNHLRRQLNSSAKARPFLASARSIVQSRSMRSTLSIRSMWTGFYMMRRSATRFGPVRSGRFGLGAPRRGFWSRSTGHRMKRGK